MKVVESSNVDMSSIKVVLQNGFVLVKTRVQIVDWFLTRNYVM